jgi:hypothetical protein
MFELIHDVETGEVITRDYSVTEIKEAEKKQAETDAKLAAEREQIAKLQAIRQSVFVKLGLTAEEAAALLS